MSILRNLEQSVFKYLKDKIKLGSLNKDQIAEVIRFQMETLKTLDMSFSAFDKASLSKLMEKYQGLQFNKNHKYDISKYVMSFKVQMHGKAAATEKIHPFSAHANTSRFFMKLLQEINKNLDELFPTESITLFECKISNVMLLGILREIDIFCRCATVHWTHFIDACTTGETIPLGYQAEYFVKNFDKYAEIINDVHEKEHNYSFMKDVGDLKQKNADMVLYANQQSFLNFLNPNSLGKNAMQYVKYGIFGFGIFTWIMSLWDDWRHIQYLRNKDFKEWMENRVALLRMELANTNPNSPEYIRLVNIIKSYDAKIADYDRKLANYEKE